MGVFPFNLFRPNTCKRRPSSTVEMPDLSRVPASRPFPNDIWGVFALKDLFSIEIDSPPVFYRIYANRIFVAPEKRVIFGRTTKAYFQYSKVQMKVYPIPYLSAPSKDVLQCN
jgi:hypothetical protein